VDEQLALALGLVVVARCGLIGRDVDVQQPQLAIAHERVAVLDLGLALAQRLHLRARERNAAFEAVE